MCLIFSMVVKHRYDLDFHLESVISNIYICILFPILIFVFHISPESDTKEDIGCNLNSKAPANLDAAKQRYHTLFTLFKCNAV